MARLFSLVGATVGSALGWWLGEHVGLMTAFLASTAIRLRRSDGDSHDALGGGVSNRSSSK